MFASATLSPLLSVPHYPNPKPNHSSKLSFTRRHLLFLSTSSLSVPSPLSSSAIPQPPPPPDTTVTDRVYMDFSICPTSFRPEADDCRDSLPLGRLVIGLYGHLVPLTVSNFKAMCTGSSGSSYKNTLVQKIFPGQFFVAGRQGRRDKGEVRPPLDLARNTETVDSRAFALRHSKAGVVSLCLSENDDDDEIKLNPDYRNVEFLITTGPGPCPQLDNRNIVFGSVLEDSSCHNDPLPALPPFELSWRHHSPLVTGLVIDKHTLAWLDVVTAIASIPTYKPAERIRQLNDLAEFLGDDRAPIARATWNKPLKTVYISDCGELKVTKPSLSPSLP
ncbi:Peptidyl-prolyl cis-trans isomerase CYP28, chloroplastic [Vitis vinifera]|uniref:Peptidyl-prolyl cis-trans isomerase CYP28, chloroplastic n=1 Tax=Vitis vinifera TaxID=29760 RepID=A0A438J8L2_VITVI|nr:Peptidyl-prolyl cis-trans isomerase CYP28, chloroplastic [Vitis vinifera]